MTIFSLLDLTSLNSDDTPETIRALCQAATKITNDSTSHAAAVCVYPQFVADAKKLLQNSSVNIATVMNFPEGNDTLLQVIPAIKTAIQQGASEIDVVFPYQYYLRGEKNHALDFIQQCKNTCGHSILLKVILETGALRDLAIIADASCDVLQAGADFLKTSTGKMAVGATIEAATVMLYAIRDSKKPVGFKASGGIRSREQALQYIKVAEHIMGSDWVTSAHFRIGARLDAFTIKTIKTSSPFLPTYVKKPRSN